MEIENTFYVNGQFVGENSAVISVKDLAVLRGFGVFDFLITYNRRPFFLEDHVARLIQSANSIGLKIHLSQAEICTIARETLKRNDHHEESNIRLVYTGGTSSDGVTPEGNGFLMVMVTPKPIMPGNWYSDGIKIVTVKSNRFIPEAKSTNYLTAVFALNQAKQNHANEAIYVDPNGFVLEGTTSNIFMFQDNRLITPGQDILPGITRKVVLDLAAKEFEVDVRKVRQGDLISADEVFISASNKEIVPVVQVNDTTIADGKPGPNTLKIMTLFREFTTAYGRDRN